MKTVLAIRHVAFEDLGIFAEVLEAADYAIAYLDIGGGVPEALDPLEPDLAVVLGGPIGAYEDASYPFLQWETELVRQRLDARRPVLGLCLGAQIMARAAGASVYPGKGKEIGYMPVELTEAGRASCLGPLADGAPVLHWHGDTFDLPEGATRLASTPWTPNQAFSLGPTALGLQFHVEAEAGGIERWLIGHACELAAAEVDLARLRRDASRLAVPSALVGRTILRNWLEGLT